MHLLQGKDEQKLRSRLLTLPVMMAVVVSIVDRQINSLREVMRVLSEDGLLWVSPMKVSPQALSQRLRTLPVELFQQVFEPVMQRMRLKSHAKLPISKQSASATLEIDARTEQIWALAP